MFNMENIFEYFQDFFFQRKRPKRRRSQDCPIFLKQVNMKSIIKNSKHFEPVKGIKGSEEMEGRGTWALGASNAKDVSSSYLLHSPSWAFSSSFLASYCSFLVLHILHQVVGANISSVQIALQNDAKAAVKIYHPGWQNLAAFRRAQKWQ